MIQEPETGRLIYRARLQMEEGRSAEALAELQNVQTSDPEQQREIAYLSAWCHFRQEHWPDALRLLSPLYTPTSIEVDWNDADHSERERRAFYLLCLGNAAVDLSLYNDASQHFSQCIKILSERRVSLPKIRVKAHYSLAMTCIMNGFYALAIQNYEETLRLCKGNPDHEDLPDIYYGLCDAYRLLGKFERAYHYGNLALQLYEKRCDRIKEARMRNVLGRISYQMRDYARATDHYMEALSIATLINNPKMMLLNFTALADLRLAEERLDEARRYCQRAQEVAGRIETDHHFFGMMYLVCGKVAQVEGEQADSEQRQRYLQEALALYEKAKDHLSLTQAATTLAETNGRIAEVLEKLGKHQEAIAFWKSAYQSLADPRTQD